MDHDKKISAQEAARGVLAKVEQLLKASKLAKTEDASKMSGKTVLVGSEKAQGTMEKATGHEKGVHMPVSPKPWGAGSSSAGGSAISATGSKRRAENGESPSPTRSLMDSKAATDRSKEAHKKVHAEIKAMPKPNLGKSESDVTPPDGTQAQGEPASNYNGNPAPGADPVNLGKPYKGHIKLAKFMGRMEAKRQAKKAAPAATPAAQVTPDKKPV